MKAKVKATGYIVDVELSHYIGNVAWYITKCHASYSENELEFIDAPEDYWTRLEHQYAGMAMQGIWNNNSLLEKLIERAEDKEDVYLNIAEKAIGSAHALIEKLKEKEE